MIARSNAWGMWRGAEGAARARKGIWMRTDGSRRRGKLLAALALAAALVVLPGCTGDEEGEPQRVYTYTATETATAAPTVTPTPSPSPTPAPRAATATPADAGPPSGAGEGLLPPEQQARIVRLLLDAMSDPDSELFSGSLDALPAELRALFEALGADLLLGVITVDPGGPGTVVAVLPGSPAERAGLAEGDRITAVDGAPVTSGAELRAAIEAVAEGEAYTLTVRRGGAPGLLDLERETASEGDAWRAELLRSVALALLLQGAPGGPAIPPSVLGELAEETPDGLRVFAVFPGSPAEAGGVRPGDLLVSIGGRPLATMADLEALLRSLNPAGGAIEVVLLRDGEELTLEIDLAAGGMLGGGAAAR